MWNARGVGDGAGKGYGRGEPESGGGEMTPTERVGDPGLDDASFFFAWNLRS